MRNSPYHVNSDAWFMPDCADTLLVSMEITMVMRISRRPCRTRGHLMLVCMLLVERDNCCDRCLSNILDFTASSSARVGTQ
jgi:hypothetical protein